MMLRRLIIKVSYYVLTIKCIHIHFVYTCNACIQVHTYACNTYMYMHTCTCKPLFIHSYIRVHSFKYWHRYIYKNLFGPTRSR